MADAEQIRVNAVIRVLHGPFSSSKDSKLVNFRRAMPYHSRRVLGRICGTKAEEESRVSMFFNRISSGYGGGI